MKTFILMLALASSNLFANTDLIKVCSKQFGEEVVTAQIGSMSLVGEHCFINDYITVTNVDMKVVNEFLELEKEIGEQSYDVHHVNELYIYKAGYAHRLNQRNIDYKHLQILSNFAVTELSPYEVDDIYGDHYGYWTYLDVLRHAEILDKTKLAKELRYMFADKEIEVYEDDLTPELQAKIDRRAAIYDQALSNLATLIMGSNRNVTSYPLLDNNNENVADAEWVIVGDDYVIVLNKYYWL